MVASKTSLKYWAYKNVRTGANELRNVTYVIGLRLLVVFAAAHPRPKGLTGSLYTEMNNSYHRDHKITYRDGVEPCHTPGELQRQDQAG